jgi:cytidine deaminase
MPPPPIHSSSSPEAVNETCRTYNLSAADFSTLRERAQANKARAYCPYSKFRVGAVLLTQDGTFIDGANVENASYPVGTCAERVAFGRAIVDGYGRKGGFKAVAVATDLTAPGSPCGMCRQL